VDFPAFLLAALRFLSVLHLLAESNLSKGIYDGGYWNSSVTIQLWRGHLRGLAPRHPSSRLFLFEGGWLVVNYT
jgi:hypothetical protein